MKRKIQKTIIPLTHRVFISFLLLFSAISAFCANHDTFQRTNKEGILFYYYVIDEDNKKCRLWNINKYQSLSCIDNATTGTITIPDTVNGYKVTQIDNYSFTDCKNVSLFILPSYLERIGSYTFNKCSSIKHIVFPDSLKSIGQYAFSECSKLRSISIPKNVEYIYEYAFQKCTSLKLIDIRSRILKNTGSYNGNPYSNTIFSGIQNSYDYYQALKFFPIGMLSTYLEFFGFSYSYNPVYYWESEGAVFETEVEGFENMVFRVLDEDNKIAQIGWDLYGDFWGEVPPTMAVSSETTGNVILPDSVFDYEIQRIAARSFWGLNITELHLPKNLRTISRYAFEYLKIKHLQLPNSVDTIGEGSFDYCDSLVSIEMPNSVKYIGRSTFACCHNLKQVKMSDSCSYIGFFAFNYCDNLDSIRIPASVNIIGNLAFRNCSNLKRIYWGAKNADIYYPPYGGGYGPVFYHCENLRYITIGEEVESIKDYIFPNEKNNSDEFDNIDTIVCICTTPPIITDSCFSSKAYQKAHLIVPREAISAYKNATGWKKFIHISSDCLYEMTGDVNGDRLVNIADVVDVIDLLLTGSASIDDYPAADVDGDGKITVADVTVIIDMILNG